MIPLDIEKSLPAGAMYPRDPVRMGYNAAKRLAKIMSHFGLNRTARKLDPVRRRGTNLRQKSK